MAKGINSLSAKTAASAKPGKYSDGGGLCLIVSKTGAAKWDFRTMTDGKSRELGLGSACDVPFKDAREKAEGKWQALARGEDPRAKPVVPKAVPNFGHEAGALIAAMEPSWRNPKHRARWRVTLGLEPYDQSKIRIGRKAHAKHVEALTAGRAVWWSSSFGQRWFWVPAT